MSLKEFFQFGPLARPHVVGRLIFVFACAAAAAVGLASWMGATSTVVQLNVPAPSPPEDVSEGLSSEESVVSVLGVVPLDAVRSALDETIPTVAGGVENPDVPDVTQEQFEWKISRGQISVETAPGSGLVFGTDLLLEAGFTAKAAFIFNVRTGARIEATLRLKMAPTVVDWKFVPNLSIHEFTAKPSVSSLYVAGLNVASFDSAAKLKELFEKNSGAWIAAANEKLAALVDLRSDAQKAWTELTVMERVASIGDDDKIGVWVLVEPKELTFHPIDYSDPANLKTGIGLKATVRTHISESAPKRPSSGELPDLKVDANMPSDFSIRLPVTCSLETLNNLVDSQVEGQTFDDDSQGIQCKIEEAEVFGNGGRIGIRVKIDARYGRARATGVLYLVGAIELDKAAQTLRVKDLAYSVESRNLLVEAADWLLHPLLADELEQALVVKYDKEIERAKEEGLKQLEKLKETLPPSINPTLEQPELDVERVTISHGHLIAVVAANGKLSVELRAP